MLSMDLRHLLAIFVLLLNSSCRRGATNFVETRSAGASEASSSGASGASQKRKSVGVHGKGPGGLVSG